jgi:translation initiation factor 1A
MVISNAKRAKTQKNSNRRTETKARAITYKGEEQMYAVVLRVLGGPIMEVKCFDGTVMQAHTRGGRKNRRGGRSKPKYILTAGDIVLISLRDFDDTKADILLKYTVDEVNHLRDAGHVPQELVDDLGDCGIVFGGTPAVFDAGDDDDDEVKVAVDTI